MHGGGHADHNRDFVKGHKVVVPATFAVRLRDLFGGESVTASLIPIERDVTDSLPIFGCRPHSCGDLRWFSSRRVPDGKRSEKLPSLPLTLPRVFQELVVAEKE